MKRLAVLMLPLLTLGLLISSVPAAAQEQATPKAGDTILIIGDIQPVHTRPASDSPAATEILPGMKTRVLSVQADSSGQTWIYVGTNANGWIAADVHGKATSEAYSDDALEQLNQNAEDAINTDPLDVSNRILLGTVQLTQEAYEQAAAAYDLAIQINPDDGRLYEYQGAAYLAEKENQQAQDDFEQAISRGQKLAGTYNRLAMTYQNTYNWDTAIQYYQQAIQVEPEWGLPYDNLAGIYDSEKDYQNALDNYSNAVKYDPLLSDAYIQRGILYDDVVGDRDAALADFNQAIKADPGSDAAYTARAVNYSLRGDMDDAISNFKQAIQINPQNAVALFNLASTYGLMGRYSEAVNNYTEAIAVAGSDYDVSALLYRAQMYIALDDDQSALDDLNTFIQQDQGDQGNFITSAYLIRGSAYLHQHDFNLAAADYLKAAETQPAFAKNYSTQGAGFRATPLREQMIPDLQAQVAKQPQNADLYMELGALLMEFGHWQDALSAYSNASVLAPNPDLQTFIATIRENY